MKWFSRSRLLRPLLGSFGRRRRTPRRLTRTEPAAPVPAADDAPPKGCAWYDSSLDLRRGLVVQELAALRPPPKELAALRPLALA